MRRKPFFFGIFYCRLIHRPCRGLSSAERLSAFGRSGFPQNRPGPYAETDHGNFLHWVLRFLLWAMIMNVGFCQSSIPLNSQKQRRKSLFLCLDLSLSFPVIPVLRFRRRNCFENKFVIGINAYISSDFHCFCRNGFCI